MAKKFVCMFLSLLINLSDSEYFDDQPKLLTENGNFVIESARDRNISFRLIGKSYLNVNDINIIRVFAWSNQLIFPSSHIDARLAFLEERFRVFSSANDDSSINRITSRMHRLEQRISNTTSNITLSNTNRRIHKLERRMKKLMERLNADNCSSNPCHNGATCSNTFGGYNCRCSDAWTGVNCEEDVNECAIFAGTDLGCQNSVSCENTQGGYICRCKPGWLGIHCTKRTVDCTQSSAYELCGQGICVHTSDPKSYQCICNQGWTSNGTSPACTVDVNECESRVPHCSKDPEVPCINLPGSYACGQCPNGYGGNGHYCTDIDECESNNGGCSVSPFVQCINTRGSSKCGPCPFGYTGDGRYCVRTSNAQSQCDNPNICHPLATCGQNQFGISCICPQGYSGNGIGSFGCIQSTLTTNVCSPNPCLNGGLCLNVGAFGFRCVCPAGFSEPRCAGPMVNVCLPNPCRNGGTCSSVNHFVYRCSCPLGKTGRNCQSDVRSCGGVLNSLNGTLKYPLSNKYPHNSRCAWLIKTDENKVLNVTFQKFELERSQECRYDWLQIHDGRASDSYMIGRFCGSALPKNGNIISTRNMLYLWFRSDNSTAHDGFELSWNSTEPVCGGDITIKSHGIISSPGSPGPYPPNRDCIWKLVAPTNKRIHLHFFTLQIGIHEDCQYDYLDIHSGLSIDGDLLEKFCNTSHPEPLISPANELALHFHSDESGGDAGFQIHYSTIEGIPGCGGTFTAQNGELGSPIQNEEYPKNLECHYLIKMPRNSQTPVKLTFLSFDVESGEACTFDYVAIYDGSNENAPKVGQWCGKRLPPEHTAISNEVLVVFHTDSSYGSSGFRLKYETLCGGKFEDDNGVITSPRFPNPYENNRICAYDIEAPLGKAIVLNFTDFDIERDCDFDSLTIYDGVDANSTKIGSYCGNRIPPVAISTLNHMHLVFATDSVDTRPGFRAYYSFIDAGCGGIIKTQNITISPPAGEVGGYAHNTKCKWIVVAPLGHLIELSFSSFDLEELDACITDYLAIYENIITNETGAQPIGKYCGTDTPPNMMSTSRALTLIFNSDDTGNGQGFSATYQFIDAHNLCGGQFHSLAGTITSPNFPDEYATNKDCVYVINAPHGKQISLNIEEFDIEKSENCAFDSLQIRNGGSDSSSLVGTFCGTDIFRTFKSFSNRLYLHFKSDYDSGHKGFKITYDTASSGCGGTFRNTQSGTISSPDYPEPYLANMQCDYIIHVSHGSTVKLQFTDVSMEITPDCSVDYVAIYDGPNAASKLIGTVCNSNKLIELESSTNTMFIRFVTDFTNEGRGFEARFTANCQRSIYDLRGAIESPNYRDHYPPNTNCLWKIIPSQGLVVARRIFLEFSDFEVENPSDVYEYDLDYDDETRITPTNKTSKCEYDSLVIEERDISDTKNLIRSHEYCGSSMPDRMNTSNAVFIIFKSDPSVTGRGFHLEYEIQGCGGILNKPEGSFTSPNYPKPYPHGVLCQWVIEVEYGHLVEITFVDYDFESTEGCIADSVIISNDSDQKKIISKFCGSKRKDHQNIFTSSGNKVYVTFASDFSFSGKGFTAIYKSVLAKCGGTFSFIEGNITSPNYPNNYDANTYCQWLLRTEPSHSIQFEFLDFDLENDCEADSVQIYDGPVKTADKMLLKSCGSQSTGLTSPNRTGLLGFNIPLRTESNEMLIVMEADHGVEAKGFAAQYKTACGRKIVTSSSGNIDIGNSIRWTFKSCLWVISASNPNQHVSLTIMHLENDPVIQNFLSRGQNETVAKCTARIGIHDGTSTNSPKITEICSSKHPPTIISEGNSLTISLAIENDFSFTFNLKAYYTVIDNECGGEFNSISGQIASPSYPKTYKNNIECEWTLKASPGNKLRVNIDMLDVDETEHCNGDYLEIRENNSNGKLIGIYCGQNAPSILPTANTYWIKFRSDDDGVGKGFLIEYNYVKLIEQTGDSGIITSMLYPFFVTSTIGSYKWRITVDMESLIRVTIDDYILKQNCRIQIYDGFDVGSGTLAIVETDHIPDEPILSNSNMVLIEYDSPLFCESKFKLIWNKVPKSEKMVQKNLTNSLNCSANSIITVAVGETLELSSPGYPNGYDRFLDCVWTFLPAQMGYHVDISFVAIDLEMTPNCFADYVRIASGSEMDSFKYETPMCSMNLDHSFRFHGDPNLRVNFHSDTFVNRTGFTSVVMLDCGGLVEGSHGQITGEMTTYNRSLLWMNETCNWIVSVNRGRTIKFDFEKLNLSRNADGSCNNFILIRNGIHEDSPFLGDGKFCDGSPTIPPTSGNKAFVQFIRNHIYSRSTDFILKYQQIEYDCGGTHTLDYSLDSITISTPNYPNIPSPHIDCLWRVTAPNGELLRVEFLERFDLTPTPTCSSEYVEFREGMTSTAPVIGKFCHEKPQPIFSTSNTISFKYFSDVAIPRNGFKLKVSFARCGKSIVAVRGFISSPGYPAIGAYPTPATCDYYISGHAGRPLNFTFESLDLPQAENCSGVDRIHIYSWARNFDGNKTLNEVSVVCSNAKPGNILSASSNALVRFITQSSNSRYGGFRLKFESSLNECSETIEASTGIIESPGYPVGQDTSRYCDWKITVPKGRRVKIDVLDFNMNPHDNDMLKGRISLYNDLQFMSYIISIYSSTDTSKPIYSSDNTMGIASVIKLNVGYRGFKLRFSSDEPTICNYNLDENVGAFETPANVTKFYCELIRTRPFFESQPNVGTLSVRINEEKRFTIRTPCTPNLNTGISVIYTNEDKRFFYTKCPAKYDNIVSPYPDTKIILKDSFYSKYRFQYKVHQCGGILTESITRIVLPTLAQNYGELDCAWHYKSNMDRDIQMIISIPSMNCETEYLNVYRGKSSNRPRIAHICGDSQVSNRSIGINGQYTYIEYHVDNYTPNKTAFQIEIVSSNGICGGIINTPNYIFSSPKNGTKYPANTECEWIIHAESGYHIGLTFINRFMIEYSPSCEKDYLKVFDKVDGQFIEIAKICGREFPKYLNSTGKEMKILFHTDRDGDGDGFTVKWIENCGGIFKANSKSQIITSPHYPEPYQRNVFCNYSIIAEKEGEHVTVKFRTLDLEVSNNCVYDNVTIYYPTYFYRYKMREIGSYCHNTSALIFRNRNRIDVIFRSDSFMERSGFLLEYNTDQCGGNITESTKISSIDNENGDGYIAAANCVWFIRAPIDQKIVIRFEQFELEYSMQCLLDYVEVYEGDHLIQSKRKARLCGNLTQHAPSVNIDSNSALVKFVSDETLQENGFSALVLFTKNCNEHINLTSTHPTHILNKLTSEYEPLLNCEYFISVPKGYVVLAKFKQMHLQPCTTTTVNDSCTCDYLNVRDGSGPFAEPFGSFCGHSNPPDMQSSAGDMFMRFVTDNIDSGAGFSVQLEMIASPCGPDTYHLNRNSSSVTIHSPMSGGVYMPNANCKWQISTDEDEIIEIIFDKFDLEEDPNNKCTADFLEITEDHDKQFIREGYGANTVFSGSNSMKDQYFFWGKQWPTAAHRYCGSGKPIDYFSTLQSVHVQFKSNEVIEKTGFAFTAKLVSECSRNYTALQGRFLVKLLDCEQFIHVPENYTISLYFTSERYILLEECSESIAVLNVYDARNDTLLKYYCDDVQPLFTNSNFIKLKFRNATALFAGAVFDVTYLATDKGSGCGGELYNYGGQLSSPGYPNTDRNNSDCYWTINVPINLVVALKFQVFDMGAKSGCELNYVEISEKDENIAPTRFCGNDDPAPYKAKTNQLKLHFRSRTHFDGTGWMAHFMAIRENSNIDKI